MALDEEAMVDAQTAARIVTAAVQTTWDRDFISKDKIKGWLLEQVQRVPFDPRSVTLLDYVKSRMAAAEMQQRQQQQVSQQQQQHVQVPSPSLQQQQQQQQQLYQQQHQQPQYYNQQNGNASQISQPFTQPSQPSFQQQQQAQASSSYTTSAQKAPTNGTQYTVLSDDESSGQQSEEDQQYQFDLSDFAEPSNKSENSYAAASQSSASPLPPPLSQSSQQQSAQPQQSSVSPATMFPYATGHPQQSLPTSQPFLQTSAVQQPQQQQHTFYHHQALPVSQPMGLNPALLLNNQARLMPQQPQAVSPHQLTQPSALQVNGVSLASSSRNPSTPQAAASVSGSSNNPKVRRRSEVEVVVPQRREGVPSSSASSAKRKKTNDTNGDAARQPLSATASTAQQKQAQSQQQQAGPSSSSATINPSTSQPLQSILSVTPNTPQPPSEAQQIWNDIREEMQKTLRGAKSTPHKTVMKMFKLLAPFVSEPPDALLRQGSREAFITDLRVPAEARMEVLNIIEHLTGDDFDVIFVVDPRATTLLHEWAKDLAMIAKGKYTGPESAEEIKKTASSLMAVFRKLPISVDVLQTLKGVGKNVASVSKSDLFDENTKEMAKILVKKWKLLIEKAQGASRRATTPSIPAPTTTTTTTTKKRAESSGTAAGADEESRKKRRVSPSAGTTKPPASTSTTKSLPNAADKSASTSSSAAVKGSGTQPLGRLPTSAKPVTGKVLPSFAKRKPAAAPAPKPAAPAKPAQPAAAPAAFDPFALSLQHMAASKESAAGVGMSVGDTLSMLNKAVDAASSKGGSSSIPRPGQSKKKSVRWVEDDKLRMIKIVEKLVYGDEYGNEITTSDYFNTTGETVGEHEGVAMKGLVEQIDWDEPQVVDRKLSQEALDLIVEYPHPELIESGKCERDIQLEREKTVLATTYFSEEDVPYSPAEPTAETSTPSIPAVTEPVIMRLSHDLANDQAVQLSIFQAQTARSYGPAQASSQSASSTANQETTSSATQQSEIPPAVAGADLSSLLAQLSGSGLASLNAAPGQAAMPQQMQQGPPQHQYPHMQQYTQPYHQRY